MISMCAKTLNRSLIVSRPDAADRNLTSGGTWLRHVACQLGRRR
jgi:hypothetical protein